MNEPILWCSVKGLICSPGIIQNEWKLSFSSWHINSLLARHTWLYPCLSVTPEPEAMHQASWRPLKGPVSAHKDSLKSKTRGMLGGSEEKSICLTRGHWFATQRNRCKSMNQSMIKWFFNYPGPTNIWLLATSLIVSTPKMLRRVNLHRQKKTALHTTTACWIHTHLWCALMFKIE